MYIELNNHEKMPFQSFGTYGIEPDKTKEVIIKTLDIGYRLFDTVYNEKELGDAVKESEIPHVVIFLSSKNYFNLLGCFIDSNFVFPYRFDDEKRMRKTSIVLILN